MSIAESIQNALTTSEPVLLIAIVGALVFLETGVVVEFFLPGDSLLFAAGMVVATRQDASLVPLMIVVSVASFLGDQLGYQLGRRYGRTYVTSRGGVRMSQLLARSERFYARYGWTAIVLARFYPWLRSLVPPVAGISAMPRAAFVGSNLFGAALWSSGITGLGYLSISVPALAHGSRFVAGACIALTFAITVRNYLKVRAELLEARHGSNDR